VGHWKLNEVTGTIAADSSNTGNAGTYFNSPLLGQVGPYPGDLATASQFNGTSNFVEIADNPAYSTHVSSGITVAAWVKVIAFDTDAHAQVRQPIVAKGNSGDWEWALYVYDWAAAGFSVWQQGGSSHSEISGGSIPVGTWVHVAGTFEGGVANRVYINGQEVAQGTSFTGSAHDGITNVRIASRLDGQFLNADISDVRIYSRALTPSEIADLYGLVGHWKMDEGIGTTTADSTTYANNATISGATWTANCAGQNALAFDGVSDSAATNAAFTPPATGSVAFWMQASGTPAVRQRLFGVNGNWEARIETNGNISFDLGASPYYGNEPFAALDIVDKDRWYHIVASFNDVDDSYAVYVNGELQASGISPVNLVPQSPGILSFGTRTGSGENWEGSLQDFRVYNRWLSSSEISTLSGLAGYWKLDETSGTVAVDSSPNGNDGTYTGGVLLNQTGNIDQAADFDGTDDYVGIPDNASLQMDDAFSMSAWIRADYSTNVDRMILNKEGEYEIALSSSGELKWGITNTDPGWSWHSTGHFVAIGKWTHVALTYDNGTVSTYADGLLVDTYSGSGTVGDNYPVLNELRLGGRSNNPSGKYFNGRLDDVRVFNRVLCPEEIFGQYKGGRPAGIRILKWVEVR